MAYTASTFRVQAAFPSATAGKTVNVTLVIDPS
jgi:hypothetical protein